MSYPVREEEITRFDGIYHKLIRADRSSGLVYPEELKRLSTIDISVLSIAATQPSIIIREIAGILGIPNSTLTSSINRLEKLDLAARVISPRDRRSFCLELTGKGQATQKAHTDFEKLYFRTLLEKLPSSEKREALMDLLESIATPDAEAENENGF
jgi:DNA-binding MarR family transcriptional regulator